MFIWRMLKTIPGDETRYVRYVSNDNHNDQINAIKDCMEFINNTLHPVLSIKTANNQEEVLVSQDKLIQLWLNRRL